MSFFWKYTLLVLTISGFLIIFFFHLKRKLKLSRNKIIFIFLFLYSYNALSTFYSWAQPDNSFYGLAIYGLLVPLFLYGILIYLWAWSPEVRNEHFLLKQKHLKYEKTGLSESFSLELKNKLEHLMSSEKLYLRHELRLDDIAELLDISRHHASQVINENFNLNFYDFVNAYRIEEAKAKLCSGFENSSESISDIAYQCGFNNRVSFYKAFKKITHTTPTEFMMRAA